MKHDRAEGCVLEGERLPFYQHIFIGVGKACAIGGAHFVDTAEIIRAQEGAWGRLHHIITVLIHFQVPRDQLAFAEAQVFADAFYIGRFETGRIVLAAGGTLQAVDLFKSLFMQRRQLLQHLVLIGALQELPENLLLLLIFLCACEHVAR